VVFLVGFMGCGKSAVGRALAALLGLGFVDLDDRIEQAAGLPVREIFAREGEPGFRLREQSALLALTPEFAPGLVIATGGGAFTQEDARAWMNARGRTVWLDASLESIEQRVPRDGSRPLYGDRAALAALYEQRRSDYALAGLRVPTGTQAPGEIARTIARALAEKELD
jgi:shikimate kinase